MTIRRERLSDGRQICGMIREVGGRQDVGPQPDLIHGAMRNNVDGLQALYSSQILGDLMQAVLGAVIDDHLHAWIDGRDNRLIIFNLGIDKDDLLNTAGRVRVRRGVCCRVVGQIAAGADRRYFGRCVEEGRRAMPFSRCDVIGVCLCGDRSRRSHCRRVEHDARLKGHHQRIGFRLLSRRYALRPLLSAAFRSPAHPQPNRS